MDEELSDTEEHVGWTSLFQHVKTELEKHRKAAMNPDDSLDASCHDQNTVGEDPLKWVKLGQKEQIKALIDESSNPSAEHGESEPPSLIQNLKILKGEKRGPFGETPLLLATLYDRRSGINIQGKRKGWHYIDGIVEILWHDVPQLRSLSYASEQKDIRGEFDGENVLHLALATKNEQLVRFFLTKPDWLSELEFNSLRKDLLDGVADGTFHSFGRFRIEIEGKEKGIPCCRFGQHPLCWAACTNQREMFDLLLENGASIECKTNLGRESPQAEESCGGDSILHMLVRQSDVRMDSGKSKWILDMFDHVRKKRQDIGSHETSLKWVKQLVKSVLVRRNAGIKVDKPVDRDHKEIKEVVDVAIKKGQGVIDKRQGGVEDEWSPKNNRGWTPLMLAAAVGSVDIFEHLVDVYAETVQWVFGSFMGSALEIDVSNIDCFFRRGKDSVLSLIVQYERKDLVGTKYISVLLDRKWKKYAKAEFDERLRSTVVLLLCFVDVIILPVVKDHRLLSGHGIERQFPNGFLTVLLLAAAIFTAGVVKLSGESCTDLARGLKKRARRAKSRFSFLFWSSIAVIVHAAHTVYFGHDLWVSIEYSVYSSLLWTVVLPRQAQPLLPTLRSLVKSATEPNFLPDPTSSWSLMPILESKVAAILTDPHLVVLGVVALCPLAPSIVKLVVENDIDHQFGEDMASIEWVSTRSKVASATTMVYIALNSFCVEASKFQAFLDWEYLASFVLALFIACDSVLFFMFPPIVFSGLLLVCLVGMLWREDMSQVLSWEKISSVFMLPLCLMVLFCPTQWFFASMTLCTLAFMRVIVYLGVYERFGDILVFMANTRADIATVLFLYSVCLAGFSINFTLLDVHSSAMNISPAQPECDNLASLFQSSANTINGSTWTAARGQAIKELGKFVWQSVNAFGGGDTSADDFSHHDPLLAFFLSLPLKVLAHIIVPLVMVNLLIALMSKEAEKTHEEAQQLSQLSRARMIAKIDSQLPDDFFAGSGPRHVAPYWHTQQDKEGVKVIYCFVDGQAEAAGQGGQTQAQASVTSTASVGLSSP